MTSHKKVAQQLDKKDILASFRDRFFHPEKVIYLDGNSLGKQPLDAKETLNTILEEQWGKKLIRSWNDHWLAVPKRIAAKLAVLLNANSNEVLVGESTSVNLYKLTHALLTSGHFPKQLVTDSLNFPTDNYILQGISTQLPIAAPITVRYSSDLVADIPLLQKTIRHAPGILCLSLVTYKSAYLYPMKALNNFAKEHDSIIIWDLSHAVGAVAIDLKQSNTLAAIGCTYKYLNGGPGAPAFIYVDQSLIASLKSPIQGWFGHEKPFDFASDYQAAEGIAKFDAGTPQILSLATLEVGLDITLEAGIDQIRAKSEQLGTYLFELIKAELLTLGYALESPEAVNERGAHITISHKESWRICQCLLNPKDYRLKIIPDFRPNRFIRLGIAPLYTRYEDMWETVYRLKEVVLEKEYEYHDGNQPTVT
jgi:kynureninase